MNSITDLLDLEDNDVIISNIDVQGQTKVLTLETPPTAHFCPVCGFRMYSWCKEKDYQPSNLAG